MQAIAYNITSGDITNSVGPMTWSSSNSGVVTTTPFVPAGQPNVLNQVQITAKSPGITNLVASVSGVSSNPFPFTTCLIQAIYLQIGGQNQAGNSITVNNGASIPITAIAVDTLCGVANNTPLASAPLTWSTTNPEVAAFSTATSSAVTNNATARNNLGGATLFASCTPPSCNIGVLPSLPIYATDYNVTAPPTKCQPPNVTNAYGTISVQVTSTALTPPTYTAWAATTDCGDALGCTSSLFAVTPGTTPIDSIVSITSVPRTPNSMMFNHLSSSRLYLGSDQGLMYVDVTAKSGSTVSLVSNVSTPCNVALCGRVLTISNDGKLVVVSDTVSTPSQVYIYNGSTRRGPHHPRRNRHRRRLLSRSAKTLHPYQRRQYVRLLHRGRANLGADRDLSNRRQILGGWQLRLHRGNTRAGNFDFRLFYLQSPTSPGQPGLL